MKEHEASRWDEFQKSGLLWWVNRSLHLLGWSIVITKDGDSIINAYPARTPYRGFPEASEERGFKRVSAYLAQEAEQLLKEASE